MRNIVVLSSGSTDALRDIDMVSTISLRVGSRGKAVPPIESNNSHNLHKKDFPQPGRP